MRFLIEVQVGKGGVCSAIEYGDYTWLSDFQAEVTGGLLHKAGIGDLENEDFDGRVVVKVTREDTYLNESMIPVTQVDEPLAFLLTGTGMNSPELVTFEQYMVEEMDLQDDVSK